MKLATVRSVFLVGACFIFAACSSGTPAATGTPEPAYTYLPAQVTQDCGLVPMPPNQDDDILAMCDDGTANLRAIPVLEVKLPVAMKLAQTSPNEKVLEAFCKESQHMVSMINLDTTYEFQYKRFGWDPSNGHVSIDEFDSQLEVTNCGPDPQVLIASAVAEQQAAYNKSWDAGFQFDVDHAYPGFLDLQSAKDCMENGGNGGPYLDPQTSFMTFVPSYTPRASFDDQKSLGSPVDGDTYKVPFGTGLDVFEDFVTIVGEKVYFYPSWCSALD